MVQLFHRTLWHKEWSWRRTDFRVVESTADRMVIQKRRYGLLAGGVLFVSVGGGIVALALTIAAGKIGAQITLLLFALLWALLGCAFCWASRTQRDRLTIDRQSGTIESLRAKRRKRYGESIFISDKRQLSDLECVELQMWSKLARLRFRFTNGDYMKVDDATAIAQLRTLGEALAQASGSRLVEV